MTAERDQSSVAVFDLAPDDGGAPASFQALAWYATETLIPNWPKRYRLAIDGEATPLAR